MKAIPLAILFLLIAGHAAAQVDPDPDGVGLYLDTDATVVCGTVPAFQVATLYLCLTHPSSPHGLSGWECSFTVPTNTVLVDAGFPDNGFNLKTRPEFMVAYQQPLPAADVIVLAVIDLLPISAVPADFFLNPPAAPSLPDGACYADGADPRLLIPMHPSSGDWSLPVARLNGDCAVVRDEPSDWGRMKALFGAADPEVAR
jgi:hypothetical protein